MLQDSRLFWIELITLLAPLTGHLNLKKCCKMYKKQCNILQLYHHRHVFPISLGC